MKRIPEIKCLLWLCLPALIMLFSCNTGRYQKNIDGVEIRIDNSLLKIHVCSPRIIHIVWQPTRVVKTHPSLVVLRSWPRVNWQAESFGDSLQISTAEIKAMVDLKSGAVRFMNKDNQSLIHAGGKDSSSFIPAIVQEEKTFHVEQKFLISPDEGLFGLGQFQDGVMNYRGRDILLAQANRTAVVPFLLSSGNYGILWDNYSEGWFHDRKNGMSFSAEVADDIDYYLISGNSMDEVIAGYRETTGQAPMYGKWAYGYWQSKEHYATQAELLSIAGEFRKRQIPIDNIVQDWRYWGDDNKVFSGMIWDSKRYPRPKDLIDSLHLVYHLHIMNSIWPAVGTGTQVYDELSKKGLVFSKQHWSTGRLYDAYNAEARNIYWKYLNQGLFSLGIDGFWMDGSEPELTSTADPYITSSEIKALGKNSLGTFSRYLNPYSLVHTQGVYEHQRATTSDKRVYILTRSAFTGQQRYAATTWSGDIGSNWKILRNQISAGINFCMAGIPYWASDIGGFLLNAQGGMYPDGGTDPAYQELYVRWYQFGAFCPIFRSHGTNYPREPWRFGDKGSLAYESILKFDNLRYRLMPYIYSIAWKVTNEGYTMMRGLPMDFSNDEKTFGIDNQFMFGPSLLVCPVTNEMFYKTKKQEDFIPASNLFDESSQPGKLTLRFFKGKETREKVAETPMVEISLGWAGQIPESIQQSDYTAVWTGKILSQNEGIYQFVINTDGSLKLWLDNKPVLENAGNKSFTRAVADLKLEANKLYDIRLEHYQPKPGNCNLKFEWTPPVKTSDKMPANTACYLPQSKGWYDFWTGDKLEGRKIIDRAAPLDIMPLYVKAGAILPMGPLIQYTSEKPADPVELRIFTGDNGYFELYEDEGDNYNYEKGVHAIIPLTWDEASQVLILGRRTGEFPGMLRERTFNIVWVSRNHGAGPEISARPDQTVVYKGEEINVKR